MNGKITFLTIAFFTIGIVLSSTVDADVEIVEDPLSFIPEGVIEQKLLNIGYAEKEILQYDVSWTGGIKLGQLRLEITQLNEFDESYEIKAMLSTKGGAIHYLYPIDDTHVTRVSGAKRLPYHYEVWQKEGYNYEAHRLITYDQENGKIVYWKNQKLEGKYEAGGEINNEFSSFFNSRIMPHEVDGKFIVPTFADHRRVEVVVNSVAKTKLRKTLIGTVGTTEIMPVLTFEGLYEKKGDTVIWYTDDECRVPVLINSKIKIGSLTAELVVYENSECPLYGSIVKR